jgi:hypothetical protein
MNRSLAIATPICGGVGVPRARANISIASELDARIRTPPLNAMRRSSWVKSADHLPTRPRVGAHYCRAD